MSSSGGRDRHHQNHSIHFFKVILESILRDGELRVPRSFVSRYWQRITSNVVILRLPNGTEWKVNWIKRDGDVLFHNDGWRKFSEYLSLDQEQFLVFRYEGNSQFHVILLGRNALEIEYPLIKGNDDEDDEETKVGKSDNDNSLEFLNELSANRSKKRPSSPSPSSHKTPKKMKKEEQEGPHAEIKGQKFNKTMHEKKKPQAEAKINGSDRAYEKAKIFSSKSKKPNFVGKLTSTYIERDNMGIQREFYKNYLADKEGRATLWVNKEERTWDVIIKVMTNRRQSILTNGWKKFVKDNNLELGDVCVFELKEEKCKGVSLRVVIFRVEEDSSTPQSQDQEGLSQRPSSSSLGNPKTPKANARLMPKNHFTITFDNDKHFRAIPFDFARNCFKNGGEYATLCNGKRSWDVKVLCYPDHAFARFSKNWFAFVRDCKLKNGDACRFELINKEKLVFNVSITRHIK